MPVVASPELLRELNAIRDHFAYTGNEDGLRVMAACPVLSSLLPRKPEPRDFFRKAGA